MTALVVLGVLGLTALFLAGALTYLYRWRVRKRLFPQLPRLWKGDRTRFLASTGLFVVSLLAFMVVSLATGPSLPEPQPKMAANKHLGPSFDGAPPPPPPPPAPVKPPDTQPSAAQLESQATPAPAADGQLEPETQPQQPAAAQPTAPQQPANQTPAPSTPPAQQTPGPITPKEPPATQPGQEKAAQPKAETGPAEPAPDKSAKASAPATKPQAEPTPQPEKPPTKTKAAAPKDEAPKAAPVKPAAKPPEDKTSAKAPVAEKPKKPAPEKAKPKDKAYTVCVASFKDLESAQRQVTRLVNKGLKGKIIKAELKGKGVWYRVCLGEFASTKQAAAKAKAWRDNDLVKTPFVVRLR